MTRFRYKLNGDVMHPETDSNAVLMQDNKNLETAMSEKASGSASGGDAWIEGCKKRLALMNTVWTAKGNVYASGTVASNGTQVQGVPYTSAGEVDKYVGYNVSFKQYLTACADPNSVMYKEFVGSSHRNSGIYGNSYLNDYGGYSYMGTHCTAFVMFVLGITPTYFPTNNILWAETLGYLKSKGRPQSSNVELFDMVVLTMEHALLVTEITDNSIVLSDSWPRSDKTSKHIRTTTYTKSAFDNAFFNDAHTLYRVNRDKDLEYGAEDISDIDTLTTFATKLSTCEGNYATFLLPSDYNTNYVANGGASDYYDNNKPVQIYLTKQSTGYTHIKLERLSFKTWTVVDTIDISSNTTNLVDITSKVTVAGLYRASIGTSSTSYINGYVYFEVLDTKVTVSGSLSATKVEWESKYGDPVFIKLCSKSGLDIVKYVFDGADKRKAFTVDTTNKTSGNRRYTIKKGECTFDANALHDVQKATWTTSLKTQTGISYQGIYYKVVFKGMFGTASTPLKLHGLV